MTGKDTPAFSVSPLSNVSKYAIKVNKKSDKIQINLFVNLILSDTYLTLGQPDCVLFIKKPTRAFFLHYKYCVFVMRYVVFTK